MKYNKSFGAAILLFVLLASFVQVRGFDFEDMTEEVDIQMEREKLLEMEMELKEERRAASRARARANIIDDDEEDLGNEKQKRNCPNDCSLHGSCDAPTQTCTCAKGYAGIDCSIVVTPLVSRQPVRGTVRTKEWNYFSIHLNTGQELKLIVNSTSGDCDLFVQRTRLPTREDYYQRDVSSGAVKNFVMDLKGPLAGDWYVGMFGFSTCAYTLTPISIAQNADCPNGCSNAGDCIEGKCHCQSFYGGADCSMHATLLRSGQKVSDALGAHQWNYYVFNLVRDNTFDVIVNETGNAGDVDVFVKGGSFPNETTWDYRDVSTSHNFALTVANSNNGYYYIGVYGFLATNYQIQVVSYSSCLNFCSKHGQCVAAGCQCSSGFNGQACETMVGELTDGTTANGFVSSDTWNYYHFTASTVNEITVTVNQQADEPGADCDVYIKRGSNPTLTSFDYRNVGVQSRIQINIPNPQFNTWYIGIYGYATCTYTVTQSTSTQCAPGCVAPYGTCTSTGTCACNAGWSGDDCQTPVKVLSPGTTYGPDTLSTGRWAYFLFNTTSSSVVVHMKEIEDWSIGYYWLFVSEQDFPTLSVHDYSDMNTNVQEHTIRFQTNSQGQPSQYYIGVYGSPFDLDTGDNHRGTYKLVAWGPPF